MARVSLNKATLTRQTRQLKAYQEFLPSLDLKRRQLIAEQRKARRALAEIQDALSEIEQAVRAGLPMLSNHRIDLTAMARLSGVELGEENVLGTRLPVIRAVRVEVRPYGLLAKPHWVDRLVDHLRKALELRVAQQVAGRRLFLLDGAVKTVTQRVNLFDKVLIPRTRQNIRKIRIYLSDGERAGVVRAKLAKAKKRIVP
jgi:V/A-type H+-transporting ATPase subunit D